MLYSGYLGVVKSKERYRVSRIADASLGGHITSTALHMASFYVLNVPL